VTLAQRQPIAASLFSTGAMTSTDAKDAKEAKGKDATGQFALSTELRPHTAGVRDVAFSADGVRAKSCHQSVIVFVCPLDCDCDGRGARADPGVVSQPERWHNHAGRLGVVPCALAALFCELLIAGTAAGGSVAHRAQRARVLRGVADAA
jgi:hypothetical protein